MINKVRSFDHSHISEVFAFVFTSSWSKVNYPTSARQPGVRLRVRSFTPRPRGVLLRVLLCRRLEPNQKNVCEEDHNHVPLPIPRHQGIQDEQLKPLSPHPFPCPDSTSPILYSSSWPPSPPLWASHFSLVCSPSSTYTQWHVLSICSKTPCHLGSLTQSGLYIIKSTLV